MGRSRTNFGSEEENVEFVHWEVNKTTCGMCHERPETWPHYAVPCWSIPFVKFLHINFSYLTYTSTVYFWWNWKSDLFLQENGFAQIWTYILLKIKLLFLIVYKKTSAKRTTISQSHSDPWRGDWERDKRGIQKIS